VRRGLLAVFLLVLAPPWAAAWPAETMAALSRDARRLLPRSLARLLGERESEVLDELQRFPPDVSRALAEDLPGGRLRPETVAALEAQADRAIELLRAGHVSQGLVRLGGLLRIPADLSDPVLSVGPEGWPPGVTREYYALFAANLGRMPVVLDDPDALKLTRKDLPALWQSLLERRSSGRSSSATGGWWTTGASTTARPRGRFPRSPTPARSPAPPPPGSPRGARRGETPRARRARAR